MVLLLVPLLHYRRPPLSLLFCLSPVRSSPASHVEAIEPEAGSSTLEGVELFALRDSLVGAAAHTQSKPPHCSSRQSA
jgi:hypothetical protein